MVEVSYEWEEAAYKRIADLEADLAEARAQIKQLTEALERRGEIIFGREVD